MFNGFKGNFGNSDMGAYYKFLYANNKFLIWISLAVLGFSLLAGAHFFNAFFIAYLLFISGVLFRQYFSVQKLLVFIGLAMTFGALFYLAVFQNNVSVADGFLAVSGAAAFALLSAAATYAPNGELMLAFLGKIKLKWIAIALIVIDLITLNPANPSYRVTHIVGALFGFLAIYFDRNGFNGLNFNFSSLFRKPGPYYKKPKYNNQNTRSAKVEKDEEYNTRRNREQADIDRILEKIKMSGYESLSADDKKKLFDQSRK